MAEDQASDPDMQNPCCAKLKKKFLKLEGSRNALRQAVQILEQQVNKLESENANLKKVCQEQENVEVEKKAKDKESGIVHKLEKEINELKAEITSYQEKEIKDHNEMLDARIAERDAEIKMLKEQIVKEKTRSDIVKKKAEVERKKAAEERKLLEMEKRKAEDGRKLVETERKKAEEVRFSLERLKTEVNDSRAKLMAGRTKAHELAKLIEEEKQKTVMEKKRADLERAKAEEQSKLLEVQQREARDQKVHIEHMKQMLEDEKQRREELQKKLVEIMSERGVTCGCPCSRDQKLKGDTSAKAAIIKSLKVQLKLEKKQRKYAKRIAKLEKAEKMFISQQFHHLKQDFIQISCHLKMLGDHLSHRTEGTHGLAKIDESSDILRFNLQSITPGLKCSESDFHLGKRGSKDFVRGSTRECSCFDTSGARQVRQISGIKFELESLTRGSTGNKPQSSTVCSTSTTCSDREWMGSQGMGAAFLATSSKLAGGFLNQRMIIPNLPHADAENIQNKITMVEAEKPDRSCVQNNVGDAHRSASVYEEKEGKLICHGGKKRKVLEKAEQHLARKNLKRTKDGVPKAICQQNSGISKFTNDWRGLLTEMRNETCRRYHKTFRCAEDKQGALGLQRCGQGNKDKLENASRKEEICAVINDQTDLVWFENVIRDDYMKLLALDNNDHERRYREAIERPISPNLPKIKFSVDRLEGEDHSRHLVEEIFRKSGSGKDIFEPGDYFDVIDLEINSNKLEILTSEPPVLKDSIGSIHVSEESQLNGGLALQGDLNKHEVLENFGHNFHHGHNMTLNHGKVSVAREPDVLMNTVAFAPSPKKSQENLRAKPFVVHVIEPYVSPGLNVCSNTMTREIDQPLASGLSDYQVNGRMEEHDYNYVKRKSPVVGNDSLGAGKASQTCCQRISDPSPISGSESCVYLSSKQELGYPCGGNFGVEGKTGCWVVFSDTDDEDTISRIVQASNAIASENCGRSQVDFIIMEVLYALASKGELQPEERVSVFFSLLLGNISGSLFAKSGSIMGEDILQFTKSFATEFNKVISDATSCQLFLEVCHLDILLNLIEDFLIRRRIMMRNGREPEQSCSSFLSGKFYHLKGQKIFATEIAATIDQLVAATILSASVCAALDQIGFLLEISYKILRLCKHDTTCNLLMLHIFALASGDNFFNLEKYSIISSAIKSVTSLLERGHQSLCFHLDSDMDLSFPPCKQCPFKDAVGAENFASLLMDILQDIAFARTSSVRYPSASSLYPVPDCVPRVESLYSSSKPDSLGSECEASCVLFKCGDHAADLHDYIPKGAFCYFTDIVSVVELFGCYMSWKWTSDSLLPRLVKMLESCPSNEISAAIVVLIAQVGRFGIDFGGYQQIEVSQLRCSLCALLDTYINQKNSLPNQLAVVGALVNLLPISFGEIVDGCLDHSVDSSQSDQIKLVREWFSQLDKKMQFLALSFFEHTDL